MSILNQGLEFIRPFKNIKEMFKAFGEGDLAGGLKNYAESIPGVVGIARHVVRGAPKVFTPGIAKTIQTTVSRAAKWYIRPFALTLDKVVVDPITKVSAHVGGVAAGLKATGVLAATAGIDHVIGRATKSRYISLFDALSAGMSGKPSDAVQKRIDYYKYERSGGATDGLLSIGGNPLNMALLKILRPSLFK